jgi:hypothetical protein
MNENKRKLLRFYKFEYDNELGSYVRKATLGELVIESKISSSEVEHIGEDMLCKMLSSRIRKMKKSLAKQFLMTYNFYHLIKNTEGLDANVINPHFVTDTIVALDIFDEEFNHYLALVDARLKKPKVIYFAQKEDRSLDCISMTLRVIAKQFISSESSVKRYMPNATNNHFVMR